jgi:hypothetical protein
MKVSEIVTAYESLLKIADEKIRSDLAFRIGLMKGKLENEYKAFQAKKDELISLYGDEANGVKSINPTSINFEVFAKEINLVLNVDIDLHVYKIKLSLLKDVEAVGHLIIGIMPLIDDDMGE